EAPSSKRQSVAAICLTTATHKPPQPADVLPAADCALCSSLAEAPLTLRSAFYFTSGSPPSAMARMTAVAVLLLVLLAALLLAAAIALVTIIMPFHRDASHATTSEDLPHDIDQQQDSQQFLLPSPSASPANATPAVAYGPLTHAYAKSQALNVTSHGLHTLLLAFMLYAAITTLGTLLWWMDMTRTHVKAWVCQERLAVMTVLMELLSASKCLVFTDPHSTNALCHLLVDSKASTPYPPHLCLSPSPGPQQQRPLLPPPPLEHSLQHRSSLPASLDLKPQTLFLIKSLTFSLASAAAATAASSTS
ncbi:unnamed protein product, partial [Closterium sp. NIES-54]